MPTGHSSSRLSYRDETITIRPAQSGFTLVELTIVLVIVALLLGGMLMSLTTQQDIANGKETEKRLNDFRDALLGFATAQQRLPCPAIAGATGIESPAGGGACTNNFSGFLPAITLGVTPTDTQGYAIDAWGNRVRYAVTNANANAFTTTSGLRTAWAINPATIQPDLRVCNTAANITNPDTASADCPATDQMTNTAVAIVFSTGKNGAAAPGGADELANWTSSNDRVFVNTLPSASFDDLLVWLSPNILYNRLISVGRLP